MLSHRQLSQSTISQRKGCRYLGYIYHMANFEA